MADLEGDSPDRKRLRNLIQTLRKNLPHIAFQPLGRPMPPSFGSKEEPAATRKTVLDMLEKSRALGIVFGACPKAGSAGECGTRLYHYEIPTQYSPAYILTVPGSVEALTLDIARIALLASDESVLFARAKGLEPMYEVQPYLDQARPLVQSTLPPVLGRVELRMAMITALTNLGRRTGQREDLELDRLLADAIAESRAGGFRLELAWSLTRQGKLLLDRADEINKPAALENKAMQAFIEARAILDASQDPLDWALATRGLAKAMAQTGARTASEAMLRQAASHYGEALTVFDAQRDPGDWLGSMIGLGRALQEQALLMGDQAQRHDARQKAIAAYLDAMTVATRERSPRNWVHVSFCLGTTFLESGKDRNDLEHLGRAESYFRDILDSALLEPGQNGQFQARLFLGQALQAQGAITNDVPTLEKSLDILLETMPILQRHPDALDLAHAAQALGRTRLLLGQIKSDPTFTRDGLEQYVIAWRLLATRGNTAGVQALEPIREALTSIGGLAPETRSAILTPLRERLMEADTWARTMNAPLPTWDQ